MLSDCNLSGGWLGIICERHSQWMQGFVLRGSQKQTPGGDLNGVSAMIVGMSISVAIDQKIDAGFGPENPFYSSNALPYEAPPFDRIVDGDYQPAIEAGMTQQLEEIRAIAENPAAPTFENTLVAMEKTGALLQRSIAAFSGVTGANTNPVLEAVQRELAPKLAAHHDAIYLNAKLFTRVAAVYERRESLGLNAEELRLVEIYYKGFVRDGANLSDADKEKLKKLNEEGSTLSNAFRSKVLAATKDGAYRTADKSALAGL